KRNPLFFDKQGERLVTRTEGYLDSETQLHVWDLRGQRLLYHCAESIGDVAFSPDGRWLAYQAQVRPRDLTISEFRIVEVQTGEIVGRLICHDQSIPAC